MIEPVFRKSSEPLHGLIALVLLAAFAVFRSVGYGTEHAPTPLTGTPEATPLPPSGWTGPTSLYQQPTYDPYSTQPSMSAPSLLSPPAGTGQATTGASEMQPYHGQPTLGAPQAAPGFGSQTPPALFPQTPYSPFPGAGGGDLSPLRLFQNVRLSDTWLYGSSPGDLQIHDIYLTTTMAFPNFMWTGQPWFVSPGFGLHLWDDRPYEPPDDPRVRLPSRAYSAFLDLGWQSDPQNVFGVELSGRLGVFSDFDKVKSDSFRPKGVALMRYNLTPNLAVKAGVEYLNRVDVKILPAGGFVWTPNPQTHWEVYFPQPRLANYLTTIGTRELWWYVAGEYGGGVWTVTLRDSDPSDPDNIAGRTLMDVNDLRVSLGIELNQPGARNLSQGGLFLEAGYVFEREVVLLAFPDENFKIGDTFMVRGGIAF